MRNVVHDLRYALRSLRKNPTFTAAAVLSLVLGIGANTALFSVFNSLLWKPLPVRDPRSIARIYARRDVSYFYGNFSSPVRCAFI